MRLSSHWTPSNKLNRLGGREVHELLTSWTEWNSKFTLLLHGSCDNVSLSHIRVHRMNTCVCTCVCPCVLVRMRVYTCTYVCAQYVCLRVSLNLSCTCLCLRVYMYVCTCLCVYTRTCVCLCDFHVTYVNNRWLIYHFSYQLILTPTS